MLIGYSKIFFNTLALLTILFLFSCRNNKAEKLKEVTGSVFRLEKSRAWGFDEQCFILVLSINGIEKNEFGENFYLEPKKQHFRFCDNGNRLLSNEFLVKTALLKNKQVTVYYYDNNSFLNSVYRKNHIYKAKAIIVNP